MPRNSKKSRKSSKNKVDKSWKIKLIQNQGRYKIVSQRLQQANINQIYIDKLNDAKAYDIKRTINNEKVGQCCIVEYEDYIYIFMIEVYEEKRNKGYGTEVVNYVKSKNKPIKLNVYMNDQRAIGFWMKMGFHLDMGNTIDVDLGFVYDSN